MQEFVMILLDVLDSLAVIVIAVFTVSLAKHTAKYVQQTEDLLAESRKVVGERESRLYSLAQRLFWSVVATPARVADAERFRQVGVWDSEDEREFEQLASVRGKDFGTKATTVVQSLRWLRRLAEEVRRVDPREGFQWSQVTWSTVEAHRRAALQQLGEFAELSDDVIGRHV